MNRSRAIRAPGYISAEAGPWHYLRGGAGRARLREMANKAAEKTTSDDHVEGEVVDEETQRGNQAEDSP